MAGKHGHQHVGTINQFGLIVPFCKIIAKTEAKAVSSPFTRKKKGGARTYRRDVLYKFLRETMAGFEALEGQWILPGTDAVYKFYAKRNKWKKNSVELKDGAKGHWLGHSDAKYVLVYFHGGGYVAPSTPGHVKFMFALQKHLRAQGLDISILFISYILAPHRLHPSFLEQGVSALDYLITRTNRDPSSILIAGDSAGGNLVANLLLHIGRPHPECTPYPLRKKLRAAVMISPWVSFETDSTSHKENRNRDILTKKAMDMASRTFIGEGREHDVYSEPIRAPVEWWREVAGKAVGEVLVLAGEAEVLRDGIREFAGRVVEGFNGVEENVDVEKTASTTTSRPRARFYEAPGEAHVEMVIDYLFYMHGKSKAGTSEGKIQNWLAEILKSRDEAPLEGEQHITEKMEGIADTPESIEKAEEAQRVVDREVQGKEGERVEEKERKDEVVEKENSVDGGKASEGENAPDGEKVADGKKETITVVPPTA